jgi:small subunit ribosomal protein S17
MATKKVTKTEAAPVAAAAVERNRRKLRVGIVTGDKMQKTIVVTVTNLVRHPLYGRTVKHTTRFKAHDETSDAHVGDTVEIMETRPMSKDKRWRLNQVIERAK